ncbi:MAG: XdhC family protein [Candidatus Promineofilum sp.]|nr:XdhC family protein [Promineifilum sp.]
MEGVVAAAAEALRDGQTRPRPHSPVDPQRGDRRLRWRVDLRRAAPVAGTLYVLGCGHVGRRALVSLGHWLGYRVVAWDDRAELATPQNVPDADIRLSGPLPEALLAQPIDARTYVAVVTRNVGLDRHILPHLLATPAAYIGVMGRRRRWQGTQRQLLADGVGHRTAGARRGPYRPELNAESPAEIAVAHHGPDHHGPARRRRAIRSTDNHFLYLPMFTKTTSHHLER